MAVIPKSYKQAILEGPQLDAWQLVEYHVLASNSVLWTYTIISMNRAGPTQTLELPEERKGRQNTPSSTGAHCGPTFQIMTNLSPPGMLVTVRTLGKTLKQSG